MEKTYMVSLCYRGGLLGGALFIGDDRVRFGSTKLQVPPEIRKFDLPFCRIRGRGEEQGAVPAHRHH